MSTPLTITNTFAPSSTTSANHSIFAPLHSIFPNISSLTSSTFDKAMGDLHVLRNTIVSILKSIPKPSTGFLKTRSLSFDNKPIRLPPEEYDAQMPLAHNPRRNVNTKDLSRLKEVNELLKPFYNING